MSRRFRYYLRVRYQECDAQHVVFNARYGDYIDLACFEFLRAALPRPTDMFDGTFEIQTVRQAIEWKAPARFDDVLEISVWTSRLGTTSFTLSFELRRAGEADALVTSETVYVHVDAKTFTKREIAPDDARRPRSRRRRQGHGSCRGLTCPPAARVASPSGGRNVASGLSRPRVQISQRGLRFEGSGKGPISRDGQTCLMLPSPYVARPTPTRSKNHA